LLTTRKSPEHNTPLFFQAIKKGNQASVKHLLDAKISLDVVDEHGYTPLHAAVIRGHSQVAKLLLDSKADINALSQGADSNSTPLLAAVVANNTEMVKLLIAKKADMEIADPKKKLTPLVAAIIIVNQEKSYDIASALIDAKADLEIKLDKEFTPLYMAAVNKQVALVNKLLTARANPNITVQGISMPLENILSKSDPQHKLIIDLLRAQKLEAEQFFQAIKQGDRVTVKRLLDAKISLDVVDADGYTPLHVAAECGHPDVATLLLDKKANIHTLLQHTNPVFDGLTPLLIAAIAGNTETVALLIEKNADIEMAQKGTGLTPLIAAIMGKKNPHNTANVLIDAKADLDKIVSGFTPLYVAAANKQLATVNKLLTARANPNIQVLGLTPLEHMLSMRESERQHPQHKPIVGLLLAASVSGEPENGDAQIGSHAEDLRSLMTTMALEETAMVDEQEPIDYLPRKKPEEKVALQQTTKPPTPAADQKTSSTVSPLSAVLLSQRPLGLSLADLAEIEASRQATERLRQPQSQAVLVGQSLTGVLRSDPSPVPNEPRSDNPPPDGLQPARAASR